MAPRWLLPIALVLSGCAPMTSSELPTRALASESTLPPMKTFARAQPASPLVSNVDLAKDFLDLTFELESGRSLPRMTRFEGPITIALTGSPNAAMRQDLARLQVRLQREAGLDIRPARPGERANITIEAVPRSAIRKSLPQAACFVVPNVSSLSEFRSARRSSRTNWSNLETRESIAIFVPSDTSPQEVRDCLHEELAQALGPLNDLYRLPDSVFNDDNVHTVLTGFDMMVLRITYAPELRSGMSREQVAARLPRILARINPQGEGRTGRYPDRTPKEWSDAIQTALGPGANFGTRRLAARRALTIASRADWRDHRQAFAHYANGRLLQRSDPEQAEAHFQRAEQLYAQTPGTDLHRAYVAAQRAAYALARGDNGRALSLLAGHTATASKHENAALLATLQLLQAQAMEQQGRVNEAQSIRLDSLGWARYGFGPDWAVRAKMRDIAALKPRGS